MPGSPVAGQDIIIADGAIRSGKTVAMICSFMRWSQMVFTDRDFILAGKSIGSLKRNVVRPMLQILEAWGWKYTFNRSSGIITVGTNSYHMFGANNEASQDILQGMTAAGALGDEAGLFPLSFIDQMIGRCSVAGAKVFLNCNPSGGVNHPFYKEYIEKRKKKHIYYVHFEMDDNPSLSKETKARFKRMFSGMFYSRFIRGLWVAAEGLIYDMFNAEVNVCKVEERAYTKFYLSCDYGTKNPCVFLLWGWCDGKWYCIKEYYYDSRSVGRQKTDSEYADDLLEFTGEIKYRMIVDPSALSFIELLRRRGWYVVQANNTVSAGIRRTATELLAGKILFNDCCVNTIREFSLYVWDQKSSRDEPIKENDHAMDAIRYFVNTVVSRKGSGFINM